MTTRAPGQTLTKHMRQERVNEHTTWDNIILTEYNCEYNHISLLLLKESILQDRLMLAIWLTGQQWSPGPGLCFRWTGSGFRTGQAQTRQSIVMSTSRPKTRSTPWKAWNPTLNTDCLSVLEGEIWPASSSLKASPQVWSLHKSNISLIRSLSLNSAKPMFYWCWDGFLCVPGLDAPRDLKAVDQTDNSITVEWKNSRSSIDGYRIKYGPIAGGAHGEDMFPRREGDMTWATITGNNDTAVTENCVLFTSCIAKNYS